MCKEYSKSIIPNATLCVGVAVRAVSYKITNCYWTGPEVDGEKVWVPNLITIFTAFKIHRGKPLNRWRCLVAYLKGSSYNNKHHNARCHFIYYGIY